MHTYLGCSTLHNTGLHYARKHNTVLLSHRPSQTLAFYTLFHIFQVSFKSVVKFAKHDYFAFPQKTTDLLRKSFKCIFIFFYF